MEKNQTTPKYDDVDDIIDGLQNALTKLAESKPKKKKINSTRNIINSMATEIKNLIRQGYQVKEIAEAMHTEIQTVSMSTLKGYISEIKKDVKIKTQSKTKIKKTQQNVIKKDESNTDDNNKQKNMEKNMTEKEKNLIDVPVFKPKSVDEE